MRILVIIFSALACAASLVVVGLLFEAQGRRCSECKKDYIVKNEEGKYCDYHFQVQEQREELAQRFSHGSISRSFYSR